MKNRPTNEQFREKLNRMVETLRSEIYSGVYSEEGQLPSEKLLAARFGLSNNSVRKGLERLVEEELIEKVPRVGNRIKAMPASRGQVTLVLRCNPTAVRNLELNGLLDEFRLQYPWMKVDTKIVTGNPALDENGKPEDADLYLLDNYQFQQLAENGHTEWFEPLTAREALYPPLRNLFVHAERHLLAPVIFSPVVLCYNKAHFRECGLEEPDGSWTWDDLLANAEKLTDGRGRYGFGFHIQDINRWPIFLLQSLEKFEWEPDGRLKDLRSSRLLHSMKVCKTILHNRKAFPLFFSESNADILQMFSEGKLSMILNSYMGLNLWKNADLEYDVTPIPFIREPRTLLICLGAGLGKRSRHKEEAQLLIDFLTSPRTSRYIVKHTLSIPAMRPFPSPLPDSDFRRPEHFAMFRALMFSYRTHADLNIPADAFPKLFQQMKAYWADLIDEEELCVRISEALSRRMQHTV
jgi:multiple sugar transport system substrate-binding protein